MNSNATSDNLIRVLRGRLYYQPLEFFFKCKTATCTFQLTVATETVTFPALYSTFLRDVATLETITV